jgi:TonB family protein
MDEEAIIMFEHIAERPAIRRSWPALILTISIVGHAAAGVVLLVVAMWQIARLAPPERQVRVVSRASPIPVSIDEPPPSRSVKPRAKPTLSSRPVRELVQSSKTSISNEEPEVDVEYGTVGGPGHENGVPGGRGTNPLATSIGDQGAGVPMVPMEVQQPPPAPAPRNIPEHLLKGKRTAGNEQIRPPESVRLDMVRAGTRRLTASIKMCLDAQGRVESLDILKSTGHDAYDREFLREMRGWRYQPYRIGNNAAAVCTPITFVYDMKD